MNTTPYQATLDKFETYIQSAKEKFLEKTRVRSKIEDRYHKYADEAAARVFQLFEDCFVLGYESDLKVKEGRIPNPDDDLEFKEFVDDHIELLDRDHTRCNHGTWKIICADAYRIGFGKRYDLEHFYSVGRFMKEVYEAIDILFYSNDAYIKEEEAAYHAKADAEDDQV